MRKLVLGIIAGALSVMVAWPVHAREIRMVAPIIPPHFDDHGRGRIGDIISAVMKHCGNSVTFSMVPFGRHWVDYKELKFDGLATAEADQKFPGYTTKPFIHLQDGATVIKGNIVNALKQSEHRVMVMARVHENLYKSDDIGHVNARGYLETIIDDLKESLVDRSRNVSFCTDFDDISFDIDQAIPVGQIVSELMSNTLKHAFPGDQGGEVKLYMKRLAGGKIKLAVTDNGIGLPGDFDPASVPTLGLKLVNALAGKLGAEVEMDGSEGTRFSIVFKGGLR